MKRRADASNTPNRATVRLLVTIDTECDKGPKWRVRQPLSFINILEGLPRRLQPVFEEHDIKPTYLLSPEVLADHDAAALMRSLRDKCDLGAHLHSEFIDPDPEPSSSKTNAVQCDLPPDVEYHKLANLTDLFERQIGFRPTAFRAGRFGIGRHTLPALERLGYRVDSSVTPNRWWWIERGRGVNFLGAPLQPYHPDPNDFRRTGDMHILEVPVTVTHPVWDRVPRALSRTLSPLSRWQTIALNKLGLNSARCQWLRPTYTSGAKMVAIVERAVLLARSETPVVCMMFHSNEATAGTSPYFDTPEAVDAFLGELSTFFELMRQRFDVQSVGLSTLNPR